MERTRSYTDVCGESYTMHETRQVYAVEQIKRDLESIGYSVQPVVIPACAVGAPHRRDRVWFIATDRSNARIEDLQQEREDGVFPSRIAPNTNGAGLPETGTQQRAAGVAGDGLQRDVTNPNGYRFRIRENKQKQIVECQGEANDRSCRKDGITSNPTESGFQEWVNNGKQEDAKKAKAGMDDELERLVSKQITSDSKCVRSDKIHEDLQPKQPDGPIVDGISGERDDKRYIKIPDWQNFPTQSPVCSRDDGDSLGLSGITFSRWRQESIKALGNSMVPEVVHEIFKAIEQVENTKQNNQ